MQKNLFILNFKDMSKLKNTVKIKESHLVDMIDNIVNETIKIKKQEWINEQAKKLHSHIFNIICNYS